ncbi:MAG: zinc-ribbon domain-containing protein [Candidatus Methanoperedens sp.]
MGAIKKIVLFIFAIFLSFLVLNIPVNTNELVSSTETYSEKEPYTENEYYTVSEPYATTETYYEKEPFADTKYTTQNLIYNIELTNCAQKDTTNPAKNTQTVKNLDTEGGTFSIWVGFTLPDGSETGETIGKYIQPSLSEDFTFTTNNIITYCRYKPISIPTKTISETFTNYRDVAKQRTVTKYKDVQKSREVTKFRDVPKERTVWNNEEIQKPLFEIIPLPLLGLGYAAFLIIGIMRLRKKEKLPQDVVSSSNEIIVQPLPSQIIEKSKDLSPKKPEEKGKIEIKSAYEYKGAKIFYKIKVQNSTSEAISDIKVHLFVPDVFLIINKEKAISMLEPKESKTATFEIRPTGECGECFVSGNIEYYDHGAKGRKMLNIDSRSLSVICPVLKRKEIDLKEWEKITDELIKAEENIKELLIPAENLFNITSRAIKDNGMFMLKPEITSTPQLYNGIALFYAEGVTGLRYAAYIEVIGGSRKSRLILKVWAEKDDALTGFYHRILDDIEKRIDVKIFIDDNVVQHIQIGDKIGTQVKDSFVQRSNLGDSKKKCPECGRDVEANEKFCLECGAKL